jgi:hypothetical protein
MYVLLLDATEREYLLSLLKTQRGATAKGLAAQLRSSDDVFGVVWWSEAHIALRLSEQTVPATPENIQAIRESYYCRHIADRMIEHGWSQLEEAISNLVQW